MNAKPKTQLEKFEEAARKFGAVDDDAYEAAVAKVARASKLTDEEIKALARQLREKK
jgi:F0F1-type ATP synthase delta subunit